jgi:hypothetical protein
MKLLVLVAVLVGLVLPASASAARATSVVVSAVTLSNPDRTCLRVEDPSDEISSGARIEWTITDPSGAVYVDPNFAAGWTFYSGAASLTWACVENSVLAAQGSGWTATVKIARQGRATTLAFF